MCPIGFLMLGSTPARPAERFARRKPISPAGRLPTSSRTPARPASARRTGAAHRYPLTHPPRPPPSARSVAESRPPRRSRSSTRAPNPGPPGGHLEDLAMACRTRPQSGWPPTSARLPSPDTPWTRLRRSVPPADTRQWLAGRRTWRTSRPSGRPDTPVQGDRLADGSGPGPEGDGQAADISSAQRPPSRLPIRPRPTSRPARPGPDRTGRQCACSLRPTPAATSIRTRPS